MSNHYDEQYEDTEMNERINKEWEAYIDFCTGQGLNINHKPPESYVESITFLVNGKVPVKEDKPSEDLVDSPNHYQFFEGLEAIELIARSMTEEQFYGYCLGNRMKYKLRAGNKDNTEQDLAKADKYLQLFSQYKGVCYNV